MRIAYSCWLAIASVAITLATTSTLRAQTPGWAWAASVGGAESDRPIAIATDSAGNLYLAGILADTVRLGPDLIGTPATITQFVASWTPSGTLRWARTAASGAGLQPGGMAVDTNGDVYVAAVVATGTVRVDRGILADTTLTVASGNAIVAVRYDSAGTFVWAHTLANAGTVTCAGLATGPNGIWIAGTYDNAVTLGSFAHTSAGQSDVYLALIDRDGTVLRSQSAGGIGGDVATALAADRQGNPVLLGTFAGTATFGNRTLRSDGPIGLFLTRFQPDGTVAWARADGGSTFTPVGLALGVAPGGAIAVAVSYFDRLTLADRTHTASSEADAVVAAFTASGEPTWSYEIGGPVIQSVSGVAVGADGSACITGYSQSQSVGSMFVQRVGADGRRTWQATDRAGTYGSSTYSGPVCIDARNNVYACGDFGGQMRFGGTLLTSVGSSPTSVNGHDIFLAKLAGASGLQQESAPATGAHVHIMCLGNEIRVRAIGADTHVGATLYTPLGQCVATGQLTTNGPGVWMATVNIAGQPYGAYFLVLNAEHGSAVYPIVIGE